MREVELEWADERLRLLPERAAWWPRRRTLLVSDMHLGKPAAFRAGGVPVPDGCAAADLTRLDALVERLGAERLVILGDFLHAKAGRSPETLGVLGEWRARRAGLDVLLIRGNHDDRAGDPPAELGFRIVDEPAADAADGPIAFTHYPDCPTEGRAAVCGHLHPAVQLLGAVESPRAVCFWARPDRLVLPAFGSFTGTAVVRPVEGDRVFAVGEGEVVEVRTVVVHRPRRGRGGRAAVSARRAARR